VVCCTTSYDIVDWAAFAGIEPTLMHVIAPAIPSRTAGRVPPPRGDPTDRGTAAADLARARSDSHTREHSGGGDCTAYRHFRGWSLRRRPSTVDGGLPGRFLRPRRANQCLCEYVECRRAHHSWPSPPAAGPVTGDQRGALLRAGPAHQGRRRQCARAGRCDPPTPAAWRPDTPPRDGSATRWWGQRARPPAR
jgi:hypothetical protein